MFDYANLAFAYGKPKTIGCIKTVPTDFQVHEELGFDLTGDGEHVYVLIEKQGLNTDELVKSLARTLNKSPKIISYAGLKDKQAVTRQWLSIHCPGEELACVDQLTGAGWQVLSSTRHLKKLRIGALKANSFQIVIRGVQNQEPIEQRLQQIRVTGVPNYFGEQRFGHNGQNLVKARQLLLDNWRVRDHFLRGIYYSAARSALFNLMLAERVRQQVWRYALAGDVMQLAGKNSIFPLQEVDAGIEARIASFDISPALPLWGTGKKWACGQALAMMNDALVGWEDWCGALEEHKLERAYRPTVLHVQQLQWTWQDNAVTLQFTLEAGSYATSVIRELVCLEG